MYLVSTSGLKPILVDNENNNPSSKPFDRTEAKNISLLIKLLSPKKPVEIITIVFIISFTRPAINFIYIKDIMEV